MWVSEWEGRNVLEVGGGRGAGGVGVVLGRSAGLMVRMVNPWCE